MNSPENIPPSPTPAKSWWGRLTWWKKCAVIFLAFVLLLYAAEYSVNTLFMPPQATPQAIETKYKAQLDRLKEHANRKNWHPTIESREADAALFSLPEIVSAKLETSRNSYLMISEKPSTGSRWGFSTQFKGTCTKKFYETLKDGSKRTIIVYHTPYVTSTGNIGLVLEFDLAKLKP